MDIRDVFSPSFDPTASRGMAPRAPTAPTAPPAPASAGPASSAYADLFSQTEQKYRLPAGILTAIAGQESNFNPQATGQAISTPGSVHQGQRAQGMFQFMPATAKQYGLTNPNDPAMAADAAARLMRDNLDRRGGNIFGAVQDYYGRGKAMPGHPTSEQYADQILAKLNSVRAGMAPAGGMAGVEEYALDVANNRLFIGGQAVPLDAANLAASARIAPTGSAPKGLPRISAQTYQQMVQMASTPDAAGMDFAKTLAGGLLKGTGALVQAPAQMINSGINAVAGRPVMAPAANIGAMASKGLGLDTLSLGGQAARGTLQSLNEASITDLPAMGRAFDEASIGGLALMGAEGAGQLAPVLASGLFGGPILAGAAGAAQSFSGANDEARARVMSMPPQELAALPAYQNLVRQGMSPTDARLMLADRGAAGAGFAAMPAGAAEGLLFKGLPKLGNMAGQIPNRAARVGVGAALGALGEGTQEVAEGMSARAGQNLTVGTSVPLMQGTGGEFVGGAMVGGPLAGAAAMPAGNTLPAPASPPPASPPPVSPPPGVQPDLFDGPDQTNPPVQGDMFGGGGDEGGGSPPATPNPEQGDLFNGMPPAAKQTQQGLFDPQQIETAPGAVARTQERAWFESEPEKAPAVPPQQRQVPAATPPAQAFDPEKALIAGLVENKIANRAKAPAVAASFIAAAKQGPQAVTDWINKRNYTGANLDQKIAWLEEQGAAIYAARPQQVETNPLFELSQTPAEPLAPPLEPQEPVTDESAMRARSAELFAAFKAAEDRGDFFTSRRVREQADRELGPFYRGELTPEVAPGQASLFPPNPTPRRQVGPDKSSWTNQNAQLARDQSDRAGLTDEIESLFSQGLTAQQVLSAIKSRLSFVPIEDRAGWVVGVRATLGIPSQIGEEGKAEFDTWRKEYMARRAARQAAIPTPKGAPSEGAQQSGEADARPVEPAPPAAPAPVAGESRPAERTDVQRSEPAQPAHDTGGGRVRRAPRASVAGRAADQPVGVLRSPTETLTPAKKATKKADTPAPAPAESPKRRGAKLVKPQPTAEETPREKSPAVPAERKPETAPKQPPRDEKPRVSTESRQTDPVQGVSGQEETDVAAKVAKWRKRLGAKVLAPQMEGGRAYASEGEEVASSMEIVLRSDTLTTKRQAAITNIFDAALHASKRLRQVATEFLFDPEVGVSEAERTLAEQTLRHAEIIQEQQEAQRRNEAEEQSQATRGPRAKAPTADRVGAKDRAPGPVTITRMAPLEPASSTTTAEQRVKAQQHADEVGGPIAWQDGDLALIRGFSRFTGDPVYVAVNGDQRAASVGIHQFNGDLLTPEQLTRLRGIATQLEKDAEEAHKTAPFLKLDGLTFSENIPEKVAGVVRGWADLLNLTGNVYVTTRAEALTNRDKFTGPHRAIGSGTLNANELGSMRTMANGDHYIIFTPSTSTTRMLELLAHEMGHLHMKQAYKAAGPSMQGLLRAEFNKWRAARAGGTAREFVDSLRARSTARATLVPAGMPASSMNAYWKDFNEWYADQVSRWAMSAKKPQGVVEQFFGKLGQALRRFYDSLKGQSYLPNETFAAYLDAATEQPIVATDVEQGDSTASSMLAWGEWESNDRGGRNDTLRRLYRRLQDAYDETASIEEAVTAARAAATPAERSILRALARDDFLGFDYPHQAIAAIIEAPDNYDMSPALKSAISRLGNTLARSAAPREEYDLSAGELAGVQVKVQQVIEGEVEEVVTDAKSALDDVNEEADAYRQYLKECL